MTLSDLELAKYSMIRSIA